MMIKRISIWLLTLIPVLLTAQESFKIKYGPYLQNVGENEVTVVWVTSKNALAWVETAPDDGSHFYAETRPQYFQTENGRKLVGTLHRLSGKMILENYAQLWHIEKAFRISKTNLRIRPIYHRLKHRIEAHICIAFTAYSIYKELDSILQKEKSNLSPQKANQVTHNMYQITYSLPDSKHTRTKLLKMDEQQAELYRIIEENL